jgi:hypothetical protein
LFGALLVYLMAPDDSVRSGSLGGEQRWPRFGRRVGRLGVHSLLSLPLFATPAAIAVQNAQILQQATRLAAGLQSRPAAGR